MLMSAHQNHTRPLGELENPSEFVARHIGIAPEDERRMLSVIGMTSRQALIDAVVPRSIARAAPMSLPAPLDEATSAAEAMTLAARVGKSKSTTFFVADDVLPQTLEVVRTRARPLGITVVAGKPDEAAAAGAFAALFQYPGVNGVVRDLKPV